MDSELLITIIKNIIQQQIKLPFSLATIKGDNQKVQFDGEDVPSHKEYKKLNNITLKDGDRVLLAHVGSTFVILGKLT